MKTNLVLSLLLITGVMQAQPRDAGQLVVPNGYEIYDSLRFGLFGSEGVADSITDSVHCKFAYSWGGITYPVTTTLGSKKGYMGDYYPLPLFKLATYFKQRVFLALPQRLPFSLCRGFFWRYNDASGINWKARAHNNSYDANDISPYSEYPQSDSIVQATFHTLRFNNTDSIVAYGDEGRVIAGWNNERLWGLNGQKADLSATIPNTTFPQGPIVGGLHAPDTAKLFSTTLEFAIDTTNIDTAVNNGRLLNNLPLVRFQVIYKMGDTLNSFTTHFQDGWSVLPFVPFRDASHLSNPGWWRVLDTTITLAIYRKLDDDWRKEDQMAFGVGQPGYLAVLSTSAS